MVYHIFQNHHPYSVVFEVFVLLVGQAAIEVSQVIARMRLVMGVMGVMEVVVSRMRLVMEAMGVMEEVVVSRMRLVMEAMGVMEVVVVSRMRLGLGYLQPKMERKRKTCQNLEKSLMKKVCLFGFQMGAMIVVFVL